jgi:hypothetical protein
VQTGRPGAEVAPFVELSYAAVREKDPAGAFRATGRVHMATDFGDVELPFATR